jgi:LPXTG-motif cell wall-anchored protein
MMTRKKVSFGAFVFAALIGTGVVPAHAAPESHPALPANDLLYAIPCHSEDPILELVNTIDSTFTSVGVSHNIDGSRCAYQPAFNPITGKSYFLAGNFPDEIQRWILVEVSTSDGFMSKIGTVNFGGTENNDGPGNLIITNEGASYFISGGILYPLSLTDASLGSPINVSDMYPADPIYAAGCSPVAATCYVLSEDGDFFELDVTNGTLESLGSLENVGVTEGNYSLQVDSSGTLWASSNRALSSFEASDPVGTYFQGPEFPQYSGALLLTTSAVLADTGGNTQNLVLYLGISALVALVGAGLVLAARRRSV